MRRRMRNLHIELEHAAEGLGSDSERTARSLTRLP